MVVEVVARSRRRWRGEASVYDVFVFGCWFGFLVLLTAEAAVLLLWLRRGRAARKAFFQVGWSLAGS